MQSLSVTGLAFGLLVSSLGTSILAQGGVQGGAPRQEGTIVSSAVRAVATLQAEAEEPARRRSMTRTWGGIALIGAGFAISYGFGADPCTVIERPNYYYEECRYGTDAPMNAADWVGVGAIVVGMGLATMWSDVPANAITVSVAPDRVRVGKTFGF